MLQYQTLVKSTIYLQITQRNFSWVFSTWRSTDKQAERNEESRKTRDKCLDSAEATSKVRSSGCASLNQP